MTKTRVQRAARAAKRTIDTTQGPAVQPTTKRPRGPTPSIDDRPDQAADSPIGFWVRQGHWPPDLMAGMGHALALDVADRQNAHSMTLAARGIVELFRLVHREEELHRQILSFSISHDYCSVRLYGYYPVIDGKDTKYFRHPIHKFDFTALDGKDKWTAYWFTKNIYDLWMPEHVKKICSAIDQLPAEIDFGVPARSDCLSQGPESLGRSEDPY